MWAHNLIESINMLPESFSYNKRFYIDAIISATQYSIGQIPHIDESRKRLKSIYNSEQLTNMPNDIVLLFAEDEKIKMAILAMYKIDGKRNPITIFPFTNFPISKGGKKDIWSIYPFSFEIYGDSTFGASYDIPLCKYLGFKEGFENSEEFKVMLKLVGRTQVTTFQHFLMLINCKNVYTTEIAPPIKVNKKRIVFGKQPIYSYHILNVSTSVNSQKRQSMISDNHVRLHMCRGHFKQYFTNNALFGKYTGLYWWQPHLRGQNKDGFVDKDYKIETTEASA